MVITTYFNWKWRNAISHIFYCSCKPALLPNINSYVHISLINKAEAAFVHPLQKFKELIDESSWAWCRSNGSQQYPTSVISTKSYGNALYVHCYKKITLSCMKYSQTTVIGFDFVMQTWCLFFFFTEIHSAPKRYHVSPGQYFIITVQFTSLK